MAEKENLFEKYKGDFDKFDVYRVVIHLKDIAGGSPNKEDLVGSWIDAKNKKKTDDERKKLKEATLSELEDAKRDAEESNKNCFKCDDKGLYIEGRQVKAMLKESANILRTLVHGPKGKGIAGFKSKVADRVFVEEERIYLGRDEPSWTESKPIHVEVRGIPQHALKVVEIVNDVEIQFTIKRLQCSDVPEKALMETLDYAQEIGLGADRSQGRGKFKVISVIKKV